MNQLFVNNLTVIDFSYLHTERGILGESWIVDIELEGDLDEQGMLFDFGDVKKKIKNIIDHEVDHKFVVPAAHQSISINTQGTLAKVVYNAPSGEQIIHHSPLESLTQIKDVEISKENISAYLCDRILHQLPSNVKGICIQLREEVIKGEFYHYSHGLKKHKGNCQRIAHGHRSTINIYRDGKPAHDLEKQWASIFEDIYIGTESDIAGNPLINGHPHTHFAYSAIQGDFELIIPSRQVYIIKTDSTVEWIATHISEQLKAQYPTSQFRVKAFEGVGKGAIAER
ncbi:6-pyruvoyl trahydropterin synthase family protein [Alkalimarinus coralli]|uniref:6-pyruvoyl trahydropterin synthase family protein n=1 Tax=Alkalimarinus coralli TaxID=2935863 RepID=UPI00202B47F8|nr:6-carboxytetrahydropterin synthase [Alkalimarinus coralli]